MEKLYLLVSWLKKKYEHCVPRFDLNEMVNCFHELVKYHEAEKTHTSLLIQDMNDMREKYEAETVYMKKLLTETLGLSPASLSSKGIRNLNTLVDCAMTLEVKDTSLSSFFSAMSAMTSKIYETELKNNQISLEVTNIKEKLTSVLALEQQLKKDVEKTEKIVEAEEVQCEIKSNTVSFIKGKFEGICSKIKVSKEKLYEVKLNDTLTHEALVNLSKEVCAKEEEIKPLKARLKSYYNLPTSNALAQVMLEEAKQSLADLEDEFTKELQMMLQ